MLEARGEKQNKPDKVISGLKRNDRNKGLGSAGHGRSHPGIDILKNSKKQEEECKSPIASKDSFNLDYKSPQLKMSSIQEEKPKARKSSEKPNKI